MKDIKNLFWFAKRLVRPFCYKEKVIAAIVYKEGEYNLELATFLPYKKWSDPRIKQALSHLASQMQELSKEVQKHSEEL